MKNLGQHGLANPNLLFAIFSDFPCSARIDSPWSPYKRIAITSSIRAMDVAANGRATAHLRSVGARSAVKSVQKKQLHI